MSDIYVDMRGFLQLSFVSFFSGLQGRVCSYRPVYHRYICLIPCLACRAACFRQQQGLVGGPAFAAETRRHICCVEKPWARELASGCTILCAAAERFAFVYRVCEFAQSVSLPSRISQETVRVVLTVFSEISDLSKDLRRHSCCWWTSFTQAGRRLCGQALGWTPYVLHTSAQQPSRFASL